MKKLIIFGNTEVARLASYYFDRDSEYEIECFAVDREFLKEEELCGYPVVEFETVQDAFPPGEYDMFVAVGPNKMNAIREEKIREAIEKGYELASYQSPSAICHSDYGYNTLIADYAVINPFTKIGNGNCFWEFTLVANDSEVGDFCYFSPRSVLASYSKVENNAVLGSGSIVKSRVRIGYKTLLGAGCFLSKDSEDYAVYGRRSEPSLGNVSDKVKSWT